MTKIETEKISHNQKTPEGAFLMDKNKKAPRGANLKQKENYLYNPHKIAKLSGMSSYPKII